jgi:hypothetical protein
MQLLGLRSLCTVCVGYIRANTPHDIFSQLNEFRTDFYPLPKA